MTLLTYVHLDWLENKKYIQISAQIGQMFNCLNRVNLTNHVNIEKKFSRWEKWDRLD